jgi:hypothetical protein
MEVVLQISLLTVSLSLGLAMLLRRAGAGRTQHGSFDVGSVSPSWLVEHRVRGRKD